MINLKGKKILLGLSSSIAVQKLPALIELLKSKGAELELIATANSLKLIGKEELEDALGKKIWVEMFSSYHSEGTEPARLRHSGEESQARQGKILCSAQDYSEKEGSLYPHIDLAKWADLVLLAPATANLIAKLAHGLADDLLSTMMLVYQGDVFLAPAMNVKMWNNFFVQSNLKILRSAQNDTVSFYILQPQEGQLACGDIGIGRMMEPVDILCHIEEYFADREILKGKKIMITAGPTREYLDPVRFISNASSGKMGRALADQARLMGAEVTLIEGELTGQQMLDEVKANISTCDAFISAAAVCDFKPESFSEQKIKKIDSSLSLKMIKTEDILSWVGSLRAENKDLKIVGFALETESLIQNARKKLIEKGADMIVANTPENIGSDQGTFCLVTKHDEVWREGSKAEIAKELLKLLWK